MAGDAGKPIDVVVLGAGITGLMAAWKLAEAGVKVTVVDKSDQPGGMIKTHREGEWLLDIGPNSIGFREDDDIHKMLRSLGLEKELLMRPLRESERYIWRRGCLRRVPTSPLHLFQRNALSRRTVTRAAVRMWKRHTLPEHDISVGAYFSTCVGRKIVDHVLAPAMAGIYAADPFCLSMQTVMPRLYDASRGHTSLGGALRKMKNQRVASPAGGGRTVLASFRGGMATLSQSIAEHAQRSGVEFIPHYNSTSVTREADGTWTIADGNGRRLTTENLLCTVPAAAAAELMKDAAPKAAELLRRIRYAPMVMAHVGVKEDEVGVAHPGFGYLAVRDSGVRSLGMIWNDRMFEGRAPAGHRLFTIFFGGQIDPPAFHLPDADVLEIIKRDLRQTMQWTGDALAMSRITRMPAAIPLMEVGHCERIRVLQSSLPPRLTITGNYVAGVSVPSCMRAGIAIAESLAEAGQK